MFRFSIRELLLLTTIVGLALVVTLQNWPDTSGRRLSRRECAVYAEAIRSTLHLYHPDGRLYLSIAGNDPPRELCGQVLLPASRAHLLVDPQDESEDSRKRIFDRVNGEPGSLITAKIIGWIGNDRVKVRCESHTGELWGAGGIISLRLQNGGWVLEGEDPNSSWVS